MAVEARMTCGPVQKHPPSGTHTIEYDNQTPEEVELQQHDIELTAYIDADDDKTKRWAVWTPSARLEMTVMNPEAAKYFEPGGDYRVIIQKIQPNKARS